MGHIQNRLDIRDLPYSVEQLASLASACDTDTALILGKRVSDEGVRFGYVLIVLIVRNRRPVTIMTRRQSQNFDKRNFSVNKIQYISNQVI